MLRFAASIGVRLRRASVCAILYGALLQAVIADPLQVTATVDLTRRRSIGGISALDRDTWFGVYHETGYGNRVVDGKKIDEWIYEEGRMRPSRGTIGFSQFPEDPARPGYIDPASIQSFTGKLSRYVTAAQVAPDHKAIFSGRGHGDFPDYMCWPTNLTRGVFTVSNHVAHGEAVVRLFDRIAELGGLMPEWYEVTNESTVQQNFGWHWDPDAWEKLAEYHLGVADAMRASAHADSIKVAGPTDAYPFRDGPAGDFTPWERWNKTFVHLTGHRMGAYAMHTYEQSNGKTSFEDHLERFEVWHLGRLPAFLDLWANEQFITWGNTLPFVFSEYGLLTNPYGDTNAFYQIRSCNGILLSLLDRPDVVDKMSAFIPSFAPYDLANRRVLFASDDGGTSFYKTSYFDYLRFWRDLQGDYLFSQTDSPHLIQHAFLDGGTNLFVVMQNNYKRSFLVDLNTALPAGATIGSAQMQRLYHAHNDIARDPFAAVPDLGKIAIGADETVKFRIGLSGMPQQLPVWQESNHYGDRTLVPMQTGVAEVFEVHLQAEAGVTCGGGRLHLGLYAFAGFSNGLQQVSVNGVDLSGLPDLSYTAGAPRHWTQVVLRIPEGILQEGSNTVTVVPADGDSLMKMTSVRLAVEWAFLSVRGDPVDAGFRISFGSISNRFYAIDATGDLRAAWTNLISGLSAGGRVEFVDDEGAASRFYRVRVADDPTLSGGE